MSAFSMFYKLFGCMHACILHVSSVRLTRVTLLPALSIFILNCDLIKIHYVMKTSDRIQEHNVGQQMIRYRTTENPNPVHPDSFAVLVSGSPFWALEGAGSNFCGFAAFDNTLA